MSSTKPDGALEGLEDVADAPELDRTDGADAELAAAPADDEAIDAGPQGAQSEAAAPQENGTPEPATATEPPDVPAQRAVVPGTTHHRSGDRDPRAPALRRGSRGVWPHRGGGSIDRRLPPGTPGGGARRHRRAGRPHRRDRGRRTSRRLRRGDPHLSSPGDRSDRDSTLGRGRKARSWTVTCTWTDSTTCRSSTPLAGRPIPGRVRADRGGAHQPSAHGTPHRRSMSSVPPFPRGHRLPRRPRKRRGGSRWDSDAVFCVLAHHIASFPLTVRAPGGHALPSGASMRFLAVTSTILAGCGPNDGNVGIPDEPAPTTTARSVPIYGGTVASDDTLIVAADRARTTFCSYLSTVDTRRRPAPRSSSRLAASPFESRWPPIGCS